MALTNQYLQYAGIASASYNIYISGEGVFDAPKRDAKLITIPGRNGAFVQDNGRFENITITYPCFYKADKLTTFASDLAAFRAAMCEKTGYQVLFDSINTTETREAIFVDGINFKPVKDNTVVTFDLVFNCKPQRWLRTGNTAIDIKANSTVQNPTKYNAAPLFKLTGYGELRTSQPSAPFLMVENNTYGQLAMLQPFTHTIDATQGNTVLGKTLANQALLANGDLITSEPIVFTYDVSTHGATITAVNITGESGAAEGVISVTKTNSQASVAVTFTGLTFANNTASSYSKTFTLEVQFNPGGQLYHKQFTVSASYSTNVLNYFITGGADPGNITIKPSLSAGSVFGYSTKTVTDPVYIDCETGLAWYEVNGEKVDANNIVTFTTGDLPTLPKGYTIFNVPLTFSAAEMTPRWWTI